MVNVCPQWRYKMAEINFNFTSVFDTITEHYQGLLTQLEKEIQVTNSSSPSTVAGNTPEDLAKKKAELLKQQAELNKKLETLATQRKDFEEKQAKALQDAETLQNIEKEIQAARKNNANNETLNELSLKKQNAEINANTSSNAFSSSRDSLAEEYAQCSKNIVKQRENGASPIDNVILLLQERQNEETAVLKISNDPDKAGLLAQVEARYKQEFDALNNVVDQYSKFVSNKVGELILENPNKAQAFLEYAKSNAAKAAFYYGFKDLGEDFDVSKHITGVSLRFSSLPNQEQSKIRERLGQSFNANGFDGMSRGDVLIFFDQFQKGKLAVNTSPENLQKMAEMLSIMPQSEPAGNMVISHGKFNLALNFNRWRRRYTLNNAARDLERVQGKYAEKLAKLEFEFNGDKEAYAQALKDRKIFNRWYQYVNPIAWSRGISNKIKQSNLKDAPRKRLYEMTDAEYSTKMVNANSFSFYWYKAANGVSKFLKLTRESKEKRIANLEQKTLGSSPWNPRRWPQRLELKLLQKSKFRQEKKSIANMNLKQLKKQKELLQKRVNALSQEIELGGDLQKISRLKKEKEAQALLLAEATRVHTIKQKSYETAKKSLNQKFAAEAKPFEQNIVKRYNLVNEKTDFMDYSTVTGKFLYAVLEKAPATQRKQLEALVLERKQQKFENEDEFIQFVTNQLKHSGHTKTEKQDLMAVIAKAVAKEEGRGWAQSTSPSPEASDRANDENTGETNEPGRVNEGHSAPPPPAPVSENDEEWQTRSEQILKTAYEPDVYELVSPVREGENADNEQVLYQTFKNKEDEHTITIEKTSQNDYNLNAKDKDGKDTVPSVEDMKATMEAIKQDGHKTMELGDIKTPEFLARAEIAAADAGITITNLEEKRKELVEKDRENAKKIDREKEKVVATDLAKDLKINLNTDRGVKTAVNKLESLKNLQTLSPEQFASYKKSEQYTKMSDKEKKLFDDTYKLTHDENFKKSPESTRARELNRLIGRYQAATNLYAREQRKKKGKGPNPNTRAVREATRTMGLGLNRQNRQSGGR